MKNSTIPIAYSGGSYGTYLEWCLTTLTTDCQLTEPFTKIGNSHKFKGTHLVNMQEWRNYLTNDRNSFFIRIHPKTIQTESLEENIHEISRSVNYMIFLRPDDATFFLCLANQFYKVREQGWWNYAFINEISKDVIYDNWNINRGIAIEDIPTWIKREFLSYYIIPMCIDQNEFKKNLSIPKNCLQVSVSDLLDNFTATIKEIEKFANITFIKDISSLEDSHKKMLSLQQNIGIDLQCQHIIESVLNQQLYSWPPLSLLGESVIQWQLRNLGYELRCDGLDIFPTNSVQLQELIYKV